MFDYDTAAAAYGSDSASSPHDSVLGAVIDAFDSGVLLCDVAGQLLWANAAGHGELAAASAPLTLDGNQLQAASTPGLHAALRDCALSGRRQLLQLGGGQPGQALVYIVPMPSAFNGRRCVAILLGRRSERSHLTFELLARHYRLSPAERDVLLALVAGRRAAEIASERGVRISTVRSQIMALRDKSGTDGIAALIAMVAQMPPVASALRRGGVPAAAASPPARPEGLARAG